ncbi:MULTISPECIES: class I SAM-dependent methyltransferase [Bradyrhizobium]|uniref:class I SAM-dependent methyltransferase n=1 Tax=Bradyrhizobium TaxID=374 RepID=UPI00293E78ED|nr:class I SAM-dependent methyltransferase [Bradyrhizobium sp. NDS-1]WOH70246.1 class I SAM-dependent methyltransferase [Bradyrhizobium sp. NDS-1]
MTSSDAADRIVDLYQRHASDWIERRARSGLFERAWVDRFRALLPPGGAVLDLGCGSAMPIAGYLIGCGLSVAGVDSAPAMIAACRRRFPEQEWIVGDMRRLALQRRFCGILAWDSFFHLSFDDQRRMFSRFREHAAPGAVLMFTSGPAHGEATGQLGGETLYHASLDASEYRALLDRNGFRVAAHVVEDPACGGHTVWLAQLIDAPGRAE